MRYGTGTCATVISSIVQWLSPSMKHLSTWSFDSSMYFHVESDGIHCMWWKFQLCLSYSTVCATSYQFLGTRCWLIHDTYIPFQISSMQWDFRLPWWPSSAGIESQNVLLSRGHMCSMDYVCRQIPLHPLRWGGFHPTSIFVSVHLSPYPYY